MSEGAPVDEHPRIGRNDPCWCGSGQKFKHCHGREEYEQQLAATAEQRRKLIAAAVRDEVEAGWRIESHSDDRAVVVRTRSWPRRPVRRLIELDRSDNVRTERL